MIVIPAVALLGIELAVSAIGTTAVFCLIAWIASWPRLRSRATAVQAVVVFFSLALIGAAVGFIGGLSRLGVAGEIVPAVLGIVGGLSAYLFGADLSKGVIVSFAGACLSLAVFFGYIVGASERTRTDELHDARDKCVAAYSNADLMKDAAARTAFDAVMGPTCRRVLVWGQ